MPSIFVTSNERPLSINIFAFGEQCLIESFVPKKRNKEIEDPWK